MDIYSKGLKYLDSLTNFEASRKFPRYDTRNYDIENFKLLLNELGSPPDIYPIVHVAGSKGKGSVSHMLAEILKAAGYEVGLYTSPHLRSVRERISVDGRIVGPDDFGELALTLKETAPPRPKNYRTYFETLTAMAFLYFAEKNVDVAVIETGLGGRLDATNVVKPVLSVITTLELEHTSVLGDNITAIASEKAGIIKDNSVCVSAPQNEETAAVLKERAADVGVPIYIVGEDCTVDFDGKSLTYYGRELVVRDIRVGVPGSVQRTNTATAILALEHLDGFDCLESDIVTGLAVARPPARCQLIKGEPDIVVDTAHTESGVINLLAYIKELKKGKMVLVCGLSADKDIAAFAEIIGPEVDAVIAVSAEVLRSMDAGELLGYFVDINPSLDTAASVASGINRAREMAGASGMVVVAGSFYVAGEALTHLLGELL
ncbi:MAG: bifunctional folylpolyglutamate synthase/dihydrofolate synthase [bacterium]|nr:bifunctional folylpolyglutamate synthase/dihydrofolate synthase [bacterium]